MNATLSVRLDGWRQRVEQELERWLPPESAVPRRLHAAQRYSVFGAGKRIRPALAYATAQTLGVPFERVDAAACAVELIHAYSLAHDDLPAMDDDDLRRGRPTCHKAFDEATAILAGDALQTAAFAAAAELGAEAVTVLARDSGSLGVVGGQQDDLDAEGKPVDAALLERIHRRKTAALIRASCELGALAGRATPAQRAALAAYGEALGLAFQIADDVLDVTATAATLGKTPGKDAAQGKLTYVAVHGLDAARAEGARQARLAQESLVPFGERGAALAELARFVVERSS